ncbi:hypothetical protein TWF481_004447 [Arthrobotrys musiformis]|uniref:Uncharacterized protein n=1 Tax=Arthrobotrys musiformis TaxID=47236 RepID=A0AAV9WKJ1_9PEZI
MSEAFGIQLAFMLDDKSDQTSKGVEMAAHAAAVKPTLTRAPSGSVRDTSFCENFYKFDLQAKASTTWPKGYKHPIQEWEFCPLQQGHSVHPSMALTRNGRPRPSIEIPPHGKSLSLSMRASHSSRKSLTAHLHSRARAMSDSKARGSIALSPGIWQRKRSATQQLNYDKNRPLPPLPLRIKKDNEEGLQISLSFRRKRENIRRRQLQQQIELTNSGQRFTPAPIELPPKYINSEPESPRDAITPGMGDAEVVTIGLETCIPPVPAISQDQILRHGHNVRKDNYGDDGLSLFDFSFSAGSIIEQAPAEDAISPLDQRGKPDECPEECLETDLPIKAKRFGCLPMKLRLEIPESINSKSPVLLNPQEDEDAEMEKLREQAGSRCVGREETIYTEGGVEERRYVYYPTRLSMDLQRSSSVIQQKRASLGRQPPYYTNFPPPPNPEGKTHQHQKKSSTSSSRSHMTFSTFGGGGGHNNYKYDQESQVTDSEDYEADEDEDVHGNYTCASSFVSASSYPESEVSAGEESCFTPVQRLSAMSKRTIRSEKRSSRATTIDTDTTHANARPFPPFNGIRIPTPAGSSSSTSTVSRSITPQASYDVITSGAIPHVTFGLPPSPVEYMNSKKSASASNLPMIFGRSDSAQSFNSQSRSSSSSCNDPKIISDQGVATVLLLPSVEISRAPSPEPKFRHMHSNNEGLGISGLHLPGHKLSGRRSVTPTPSMFRSADGGNNSKLRVIEEEPHQQRPSTAPAAAPEYQSSRSFFEDYDDTEDVETGLSKVKRFLVRCLSVKSHMGRPPSATHETEASSKKKADEKKKAKKAEKAKDKDTEERPVPPPRPSSRFSRISRISKLGRGNGNKWRWSYAMMGATFS